MREGSPENPENPEQAGGGEEVGRDDIGDSGARTWKRVESRVGCPAVAVQHSALLHASLAGSGPEPSVQRICSQSCVATGVIGPGYR